MNEREQVTLLAAALLHSISVSNLGKDLIHAVVLQAKAVADEINQQVTK